MTKPMPTTSGPDEAASRTRLVAPHGRLLAELSLGVGAFAIGSGEFAIMGLLPNVARNLVVTVPQAGYLISIYALGVVVGAPLITVLCARMARHTLLITLDGAVRRRQRAKRAVAALWRRGPVPLPVRTAARRVLRRLRAGRCLARRARRTRTRRGSGDARPDAGDDHRRPGRRLVRPVSRLAHRLRDGGADRPRQHRADGRVPAAHRRQQRCLDADRARRVPPPAGLAGAGHRRDRLRRAVRRLQLHRAGVAAERPHVAGAGAAGAFGAGPRHGRRQHHRRALRRHGAPPHDHRPAAVGCGGVAAVHVRDP